VLKTQSYIEQVIGSLALELHRSGSEDLICDLPQNEDEPIPEENTTEYLIENGKVRFLSLASRNQLVATHVLKEKREAVESGLENWINVAYDLWCNEIGRRESAAGRFLALVHQEHDIFVNAADAIYDGRIQVFDALHTVESALPFLDTLPPEGIWRLCEAQHELTKNDLMAGVYFGALGKVMGEHSSVCRAIHQRLRKEITEATANLHPTVLVALAKSSPDESFNLVLEDAESPIALLKSMALWTAGRLIVSGFVNSESLPTISAAVTANMTSSVNNVRNTAIRAAATATAETDVFVERLTELGNKADQDALGAIAQTLWANLDRIKCKPYFTPWLRFLHKVPSSCEGILEHFDHTLSRLLSDPLYQDLALLCLTEWVEVNGKGNSRDESVPELFDTVTIELLQRPKLLSLVVTDWMLAENKRLASAAAGILAYAGIHGLEKAEFNIDRLDSLGHVDLLFLARRLLGFIISENQLLSLAMSFLKTSDAPNRTFAILRSLLVDEIGYDYPHSTIETLNAAQAADERPEFKSFYSHVIEAISSQMKALQDLPHLVELSPPPNLQRHFAKARSKQMEQAMREARKKSIIRQILTEVPIKAGVGYFSFHEGNYSEPSSLKSVSHSVTLPRRNTLDTVGAELRLWSLSNAKREES